MIVLLLRHGERAGHGNLDPTICLARRNFTFHFDGGLRRVDQRSETGLGWPDRSSAVPGLSISTPSRAVASGWNTFAAHLAIGDDIETGAFLIPNGEDRGVVLGLLKEFSSMR